MEISSSYENGYALFIGIRYSNWSDSLNAPLKDVEALLNHFRDPLKAAYRNENIIELTEESATRQGILDALDRLAEKASTNPDASVLIYYSGHGGNLGSDYFLVPYDFDLLSWNSGILNREFVIQTSTFASKINAINAKKCLVLLDCCHAENIPVDKKLMTSVKFLDEFVDILDNEITELPIKKEINSQLDKGTGRVILTSCNAEETSLDLGKISLFTKVLLECLNGNGNIEQDGWVRLLDLMRYVPKNVVKEAQQIDNHSQHPMFKRIENLSSEDFIICAYDLRKAKNAAPENLQHESKIVKSNEFVIELIDMGDYPRVFEFLDNMSIGNKAQYYRFKREFSAGLKGIDFLDFADRLKVFINQYLTA